MNIHPDFTRHVVDSISFAARELVPCEPVALVEHFKRLRIEGMPAWQAMVNARALSRIIPDFPE